MPTVTAPHFRATLSGPCGTGETWSTGFAATWGGAGTDPVQSLMNTMAEAIFTAFKTRLWATGAGYLRVQNATGVGVNKCNLSFYRGGVLTIQGQSSSGAINGTTSTGIAPGYTAMCHTLQTATFGRSGRGRMYLPYTFPSCDASSLQFPGSSPLPAALANFFADVNAVDPLIGSVAVASETKNTLYVVTNVSADTRPDTQHGRVNQAPISSRVSAAVP